MVVDVVGVLVAMELQLLLHYFHVTKDRGVDKEAKRRHLRWKILIYTFSSWTQSCSCIASASSKVDTAPSLHSSLFNLSPPPPVTTPAPPNGFLGDSSLIVVVLLGRRDGLSRLTSLSISLHAKQNLYLCLAAN
ncbi:hypothetical protein SADUNF_Sadunf03G0150800 [Salix dunnii]|uniref:Uncharacterized protein n=1 Tax=Salix dunnii TaxID=1413687 RepID=A0A835N4Y6_9ROSI|nr:hypothetical protein SADUNF_Sadunf03G0150800 [Salix dunnii]